MSMDASEFILLSNELDARYRQDQNQFDLYQFVVVNLQKDYPDLFREYEKTFRRIESNVYAQRAAQEYLSQERPF